jgi:hypothetical protein
MSTLHRRLKLSVNPLLIDKNEGGDKRAFAYGWKNTDATIEELAEAIRDGWAYGPQFDGSRSTKNFLCSDIASVDIDNGVTFDEIRQRELIRDHAALVYTTVSHTPEKPRARSLLVLPRTIHRADELRALARSLALRCDGDLAATDPARGFFGSRGAQTFIEDRQLPLDLMQELIDQSFEINNSAAGPTSATRSRLTFPPDLTVRLADGTVASVSDLDQKKACYCPFHADANPSAFTVQSKTGTTGIHCATCQTTFWPDRLADSFDFYDFDAKAKSAFEHRPVSATAGDPFSDLF